MRPRATVCAMFQAYIITCLSSGKLYIGITGKNPSRRWWEHRYNAPKHLEVGGLYAAIRKYGPGAFKIEPVCCARTWEDICAIEIALIRQHGTLAPRGYNLTIGGEGRAGFRPSAESVERSAAKHRGVPCHPNTRLAASLFHRGRKKSEAARAAMSKWHTGRRRSADTCAKISAARRGRSVNAGASNGGAKLSEDQVREARARLALGDSQRSIARSLGIHYNAIWKIAHNLKWRSVT